jgi:hypothetical protein
MKIVLIRQDAVLVTHTGRPAGAVVQCGLREPFPCEHTVQLAAADAIRIEKWLGTGIIALICSNGDVLEPAATDGCDYELSY